MTIEAEIARCLYEEVRRSAVENRIVRLGLRLEEYQRRWPSASKDQILRGIIVAYEMLVQDVAEAVAAASDNPTALPDLKKPLGDEGSDT